MEGDPKAAVEAVEQDRNPRNRGIGLCLSGGGFRATLFHLGAIQRLFELGIATSPDFDTIASVSGGSLTCAQWAIAEAQAKAENRNLDFTRDITRPILTLTGTDLRTGPLAKKLLLPWNWFRGSYAADAMVARFTLLSERCEVSSEHGLRYGYVRERVNGCYPTVEEFFVVAPAAVESKTRYGFAWFEARWRAALGESLQEKLFA